MSPARLLVGVARAGYGRAAEHCSVAVSPGKRTQTYVLAWVLRGLLPDAPEDVLQFKTPRRLNLPDARQQLSQLPMWDPSRYSCALQYVAEVSRATLVKSRPPHAYVSARSCSSC